jgi:hypothetical protein
MLPRAWDSRKQFQIKARTFNGRFRPKELKLKMQNGLREEINDVVMKYLKRKLQTGEPIDVAEMADELAQSFVDMVTEQDEEQQAPLLAQIMISLGDEYLQRRGLIPTERRDN